MFNQKDRENKDIGITESDFKARRHLLKASAAAPLIVTLSPNAALAQGSLTCAQKNVADGGLQTLPTVVEVPPMDGPLEDQAVRRIVKLYRHNGEDNSGNGADNNGIGVGNNDKPDLYYIGGIYYTENGVPTSGSGYIEIGDVYVVEYFEVLGDGTACSLGLWPVVQRGVGTVLSISCEASIGMISSCNLG